MWSPGWWGANGETDLKGSVFVWKGGGAYAKQKLASSLAGGGGAGWYHFNSLTDFKQGGIKMGKFVVVHPVGKEMTLEAVTPIGKAVKAASTVDAYWVGTRYLREEGKAYCEWDAKDAESIRQVLTKAAPELPTEGIYAIDLMVNGEDFR